MFFGSRLPEPSKMATEFALADIKPNKQPTVNHVHARETHTVTDGLHEHAPRLRRNQVNALSDKLASVDITRINNQDPTSTHTAQPLAPFAHPSHPAFGKPSFGQTFTYTSKSVFMPNPPLDPTPFTNTCRLFMMATHRWPEEPFNLLPFAGYLRTCQPLTEAGDLPRLLESWEFTLNQVSSQLAEVQQGIHVCLRYPFQIEEGEERWLRMTLIELHGFSTQGMRWVLDTAELERAIEGLQGGPLFGFPCEGEDTRRILQEEITKCVEWVDARMRDVKDANRRIATHGVTLGELQDILRERGVDI